MGGAVAIVDGALPKNLIIARAGQEEYVAAANYCTHRERALGYDQANGRSYCSSLGGSEFDLKGQVLGGAAEKPLQLFATELLGDELIINLS